MKNKVTTIYKQTERFAEITKSAIVSGNIVRAKNAWHLPSDYFSQEVTKLKMPYPMYMSFQFPLLWNCVIAPFPIFFPNRLKRNTLNKLTLQEYDGYYPFSKRISAFCAVF